MGLMTGQKRARLTAVHCSAMPTERTLAWPRRKFIGASVAALLAPRLNAADAASAGPVIDIHQHTHYHGRTDEELIRHQEVMGATLTVLLPAGSIVNRPSTHDGRSNGLEAQCYGNESVLALARAHPNQFLFFANEVPDLPEARAELEKYLRLGARGIGEQKFGVPCDSVYIERVAEVAQDHGAPVLLHFWESDYNTGFARFHTILEKFPKVNFIGHAQTWWGNIDRNHDQKVAYPKGKVSPGGISDRLLSDYPNMFGDCSAGSGLNALTRDPDFTPGFLDRHQDKLLFGSDCEDAIGSGPRCQGAQIIAAIRRFAPSNAVQRKILSENAKKLLKL
jgi:predicted TIM-barrel fold metal-dependent hydrolase